MSFFFLRKSRFLKNKRLLLFYCDQCIQNIESTSPSYMSCKDDLMREISKDLDQYVNDISTYTEKSHNFYLLARQEVSSKAFDLIQSGKYHLHGHFNQSGPGGSASNIHKTLVKEFLDKGYISQDEYDEDLLALRDAILQRL